MITLLLQPLVATGVMAEHPLPFVMSSGFDEHADSAPGFDRSPACRRLSTANFIDRTFFSAGNRRGRKPEKKIVVLAGYYFPYFSWLS